MTRMFHVVMIYSMFCHIGDLVACYADEINIRHKCHRQLFRLSTGSTTDEASLTSLMKRATAIWLWAIDNKVDSLGLQRFEIHAGPWLLVAATKGGKKLGNLVYFRVICSGIATIVTGTPGLT